MLTLIARIIFILAAGFGLRALARGPLPRARPLPKRHGAEEGGATAALRAGSFDEAEDGPLARGQTPATFASFGGSAVSAAVAGKASVDGVVERAGARERETGAGGDARAARTPALADPDPNGPTPPAADRESLGGDVLAEKHGSLAFESDFRSVDYGGGARPAWPHRDADAPDDGWTVPDPATDHRVAVASDSPAAFKGGGGAAPVRGAPERADEAQQQDAPEEGALPLSSVGVPAADAETSLPTDDPSASAEIAALAPAPARLDAPQAGVPDDLTRIDGIGPSIERLLFENGIFHFDQIAGWTAADVRWADALTGFDGRAAREKWVEQAIRLGAETGE